MSFTGKALTQKQHLIYLSCKISNGITIISMTISGLTTFCRQSSVFQALVAGGVVGLMMFAFSHIFQAPIEKHSDLQISAAATTSVVVAHASATSVEQIEAISPVVTVQSWPPTPRGGGVLPTSNVLHADLCVVGLSGVIPPPVLAFILPASVILPVSLPLNKQISTNSKSIKSNSISRGWVYVV